MTYEEKTGHLKNSPLWKYLLLDKEIRYSDFIALFMDTYKYDPFNKKNLDNQNFKIRREYKHTDLWIDYYDTEKKFIVSNSDNEDDEIDGNDNEIDDEENFIYVPKFLIENKLKSIPYKEQLIEYTKKFVDEYIASVKKEFILDHYENFDKDKTWKRPRITKRIINQKEYFKIKLNEIIKLSFHLISPISYDFEDISIEKPSIIINEATELQFTWQNHTYFQLGEQIETIINEAKSNGGEDRGYLDVLFLDFAWILQSMTIFSDELKTFNPENSIKYSFTPSGIFCDFQNMHDFFGKYRASQCAEELKKCLKVKMEAIEQTQKIQWESIKIKHSYTNKSGLFEISREIKKDLTYIIQYQGGKLEKALVIPMIEQEKNPYTNWFLTDWELNGKSIKFKPKDKGELYSYKSGSDDMFYYTCYNLGDVEKITVENIIDLMINYIQVDPWVNDMD